MDKALTSSVVEAAVFNTSFGWCGTAASKEGIRHILLPLPSRQRVLSTFKDLGIPAVEKVRDAPCTSLLKVVSAVRAYFQGDAPLFDFPLDLSGVSVFDRQVLEAAKKIPYGETRTYGELARTLGRPMAARAIGAALGRNPLPLAVP